MGKMVYGAHWKDYWFLSKPEEFHYSHLALHPDLTIDVDNQLLAKPYTSIHQWTSQVNQYTLYTGWLIEQQMSNIGLSILSI